jgi:hypothetical protein
VNMVLGISRLAEEETLDAIIKIQTFIAGTSAANGRVG